MILSDCIFRLKGISMLYKGGKNKMKNKTNKIIRNYKIEIIKLSDEDGGGFLATVPTLPGCMSDGESEEEALINVKDAIEAWIETAQELGRSIPKEDIYRDEDEFSGKLTLRIPKFLHKKVTEMAEEEGCSINQLMLMYISMGLGNDYGKDHINIILNNHQRERPIFDRLQRENWINYKENSTKDKHLFLTYE